MIKKINIGLITFLIIIIIIFLIAGGFVAYNNFFNKSEKISETSASSNQTDNQINEEKLTISSPIVLNLYNFIRSTNTFDQKLISEVINNNNEILVANIDQKLINYFGYRQLVISDLEPEVCNNFPNILARSSSPYYCGINASIDQDDSTNTTFTFSEDKLKQKVELIFGEGAYNNTSYIEVNWANGFTYDQTSHKYVLGAIAGGGTDLRYTTKLIDVKDSEEYLTLIENVSYEEYNDPSLDLNKNILYNFKKNSDGNYYLYSVNLEK